MHDAIAIRGDLDAGGFAYAMDGLATVHPDGSDWQIVLVRNCVQTYFGGANHTVVVVHGSVANFVCACTCVICMSHVIVKQCMGQGAASLLSNVLLAMFACVAIVFVLVGVFLSWR